jgi:hypothetical protein
VSPPTVLGAQLRKREERWWRKVVFIFPWSTELLELYDRVTGYAGHELLDLVFLGQRWQLEQPRERFDVYFLRCLYGGLD